MLFIQGIPVKLCLEPVASRILRVSILPRGSVTQFISDQPAREFAPLTLRVYPGADGAYELYQGDGISLGISEGNAPGQFSHGRIAADSCTPGQLHPCSLLRAFGDN